MFVKDQKEYELRAQEAMTMNPLQELKNNPTYKSSVIVSFPAPFFL